MKKIIVYLDNCAFNRPFDDQTKLAIRFEAEAKIHIQEKIKNGELELVWSYILEFENANNPFPHRKQAVLQWKNIAKYNLCESDTIIKRALEFEKMGLKSKDALHIGCAIEAGTAYFITTDKAILKKLKNSETISVVNPVNFLMELEEFQ